MPEEEPDDEVPDEEFSLEELGAAYARALGGDAEPVTEPSPADEAEPDADEELLEALQSEFDDESRMPDEWAIVEAALFVGHPKNQPLTAMRLASLMRDVTPEEIDQTVTRLNDHYAATGSGFHIVAADGGYRLSLAAAVEDLRGGFTGKVREVTLPQAAIEVLSLVAYQPGITAETIAKQRGEDSAAVLSQMVRRRLLTCRRETLPPTGKSKKPKLAPATYAPADRLFELLGLESASDLPQIDENHV